MTRFYMTKAEHSSAMQHCTADSFAYSSSRRNFVNIVTIMDISLLVSIFAVLSVIGLVVSIINIIAALVVVLSLLVLVLILTKPPEQFALY